MPVRGFYLLWTQGMENAGVQPPPGAGIDVYREEEVSLPGTPGHAVLTPMGLRHHQPP